MLAAAALLAGCGQQDEQQLLASGAELAAKGDFAAATIQFRAALQARPDFHAARAAYGTTLLAQGEVQAAVIELERVIGAAPETPDAIAAYARALTASANEKRTIQALSQLRPARPVDAATVQSHLAFAWAALGDEKRSEDALRQALATDPGHPLALTFSARRAWSQGRADEARTLVESALRSSPADPEALHFRGILAEATGDRAAAIETWRQSARSAPAHVPSYESLIAALLAANDIAGARSVLQELKSRAGWHPGARLAEARILIAEGDLQRAREPVLRMLGAAPDHPGLLTMAGYIDARIGSPIQAAAHYRKLLAANPEVAFVRIDLARLEMRMGQLAEAARTLRPLLNGAEATPQVLALASDIEMRQGNMAAADELLRRATLAAPKDARLQAAGLVRRMRLGDVEQPLLELERLAADTDGLYAEEALFSARMAMGDFDAALKVIDQLERKRPDSARHHELRARVHMARRDLPAARRAFEEAQRRDPSDFGLVAALVVVDQLEGRPEQAVARVRAVIEREPDHWAAMVLLSDLLLRSGGAVDESVELLKRALKAGPAAVEPRLRLIELSLSRRRFKEALEYSRDALATLPNDERLLEATGRAQLLSGDVEQAASTFRALVNLLPKSAVPLVQLARVYDLQGRRDSMMSTLRRAVELEPNDERVQNTYVEALFDSRQPTQALAHARRQRELRPREPLSFLLLASVQERNRDKAAAIATLRDGLAATGSPELANRLFAALVRHGRAAEAKSFAVQWLKQTPADLSIEYKLAELEIVEGDHRSAESRLRRVVERYPGDVLALNNLAWLVTNRGGEEGLALARRAVSISPERPELLDTLAFALSSGGKHQDALAVQRRVLELAPDSPAYRLGMARVALAAGDRGLARTELEALRKLDPKLASSPAVRQLEAKL